MVGVKLARVVSQNALRSGRHLLLSSFGIVFGIGAFVFFLGLSVGVRQVLVGEIFPLERVEVIAPRVSFFGADTSKKIGDEIVAAIRKHRAVEKAIPRLAVSFPAMARGYLKRSKDDWNPQTIDFEVGGFADGIDPEFVAGEDNAQFFRYWESPEEKAKQQPCSASSDCSENYYCDLQTIGNPRGDNKCHHRIPVYVSPTVLELYNSQFATSHGLPQLGEDVQAFLRQRGGFDRMWFSIRLGDTMVAGTNSHIDPSKRRSVQGMFLGVSGKAMRIGMTIPIEYVRDWNRDFAGEEAAGTYSSVVVMLRDKDQTAEFAGWLRQAHDLRIADHLGEQFSFAISVVTWLLVFISIVIVGISAINIGHNFFMQVSERRREIGVLRAVGATRGDVRLIVLGEAAVIGVIGGLLGLAFGVGLAAVADAIAGAWLPDFPFKPDSFFRFRWWILVGGVLFSLVFAVLGGFFPARRAAQMEPARALAQP